MHLASKGALIDFAVLGARKWQPIVLQLPHRLGRLPAHVLDSVLRIDTVEIREQYLQGLWSLVAKASQFARRLERLPAHVLGRVALANTGWRDPYPAESRKVLQLSRRPERLRADALELTASDSAHIRYHAAFSVVFCGVCRPLPLQAPLSRGPGVLPGNSPGTPPDGSAPVAQPHHRSVSFNSCR